MAIGFGPGTSMSKTAKENSRRKHKKTLKENSESTEHSSKIELSFENKASEDELMKMRKRMEAQNAKNKRTALISVCGVFDLVVMAVIYFVN